MAIPWATWPPTRSCECTISGLVGLWTAAAVGNECTMPVGVLYGEGDGGMTHAQGVCFTCDKLWFTKNVMGLTAQHANRYGHECWVETCNSYYNRPTPVFHYVAILRDQGGGADRCAEDEGVPISIS